MKNIFRLVIVLGSTLFLNGSAFAGLCTGSAGCWNIYCNQDVECLSAGCGGCSSGFQNEKQKLLHLEVPREGVQVIANLDAQITNPLCNVKL